MVMVTANQLKSGGNFSVVFFVFFFMLLLNELDYYETNLSFMYFFICYSGSKVTVYRWI